MKYVKTLACLFAFISLFSCNRKINHYVSEDSKDYWDFEPGAQWIYANDSFGTFDTLTVLARTREMIENLSSEDYEFDEFITIQKTGSGNLHDETDLIRSYLGAQVFEKRWPINGISYGILGNWSDFLGEETLTVQGQTYTRARHYVSDTIYNGTTIEYWIAPRVGTVKMVMVGTDTIRELVSFHE